MWECHELLDKYRDVASDRCGKCGRVRIESLVEVVKLDGKASFRGLMRCGLAWECPVCQVKLRVARAQEVLAAVEWHTTEHGPESAAMLTLTVRHGMGDDLRSIRQGVADAWRRVQAGKAWKEWRAAVGFVGSIRALEVTHGENGWHPHLHIILLTRTPVTNVFRSWVSERWQRAVVRELGPDHMPDDFHGCDLRPCHAADYLQKLGLEVSPPEKAAKGEHRTPLQLLLEFVNTGECEPLGLWRSYVANMKGARMLTWSKHLKRDAGIRGRKDREVIDGEDVDQQHVTAIKGEAWDKVRDVRGVKTEILRVSELGDHEAVNGWLSALGVQLDMWPPGYDPCTLLTMPVPAETVTASPEHIGPGG